MGKISIPAGLLYVIKLVGVAGILVFISIIAGCIDKENRLNVESHAQNISNNGLTLIDRESKLDAGYPDNNDSKKNSMVARYNASTNQSKQNQIRLIIRPIELSRTGKLPVTLKILNPGPNETVLTVFRPQFGQEWYNQTNITYIASRNWTQNFSIKPLGNISYILMFVQVSKGNTVVKKAAWNISIDTPIGRPK